MKIRNSEGYMDVVAYKAIMNVDREKKAETKSAFRPLVYVCAPFKETLKETRRRQHNSSLCLQEWLYSGNSTSAISFYER